MQEAARAISNLQAESDGVDLATLLREGPREAYAFQQLGVRPPPASFHPGAGIRTALPPPRAPERAARSRFRDASAVTVTSTRPDPPADLRHVPPRASSSRHHLISSIMILPSL
jgi:hypothetical protein